MKTSTSKKTSNTVLEGSIFFSDECNVKLAFLVETCAEEEAEKKKVSSPSKWL